MQPNGMPTNLTIPVPDKNGLRVKVTDHGYRIRRGQENAFVFVRTGEVVGLINILADAHENNEKKETK